MIRRLNFFPRISIQRSLARLAQRRLYTPSKNQFQVAPNKKFYHSVYKLIVNRSYSTSNSNTSAKENIYTLPNALTVSRILLSPVIGLCIAQNSFGWGLGLLVVASASDALDGWIARKYNLQTALGSVLDPAADKILMTTLATSLCYAGAIPLWLTALIISRDVFLAARTFYIRYVTLSPPKTWSRYWDVSLATAEVQPPFISKANTFLQLLLMATSLTGSVYGFVDFWMMDLLRYSVAGTTIASALHYLFNANFRIKSRK